MGERGGGDSTHRTGENGRDEFLVPGLELVSFNCGLLKFDWFLFHQNWNLFFWETPEKRVRLKHRSAINVQQKRRGGTLNTITLVECVPDLVLASRLESPSAAAGWVCCHRAHLVPSSHSRPGTQETKPTSQFSVAQDNKGSSWLMWYL